MLISFSTAYTGAVAFGRLESLPISPAAVSSCLPRPVYMA
nr:MAG TPA: hypothetical protein [Caudoviricetes sp.]